MLGTTLAKIIYIGLLICGGILVIDLILATTLFIAVTIKYFWNKRK